MEQLPRGHKGKEGLNGLFGGNLKFSVYSVISVVDYL